MELKFQEASERVSKGTTKVSDAKKLELYALFKQATVGPCNTSRPSMFEFVAKAKWDCWMKFSGLTKAEAMQKYITLANSLVPPVPPPSSSATTTNASTSETKQPTTSTSSNSSGGSSWLVMSRPQMKEGGGDEGLGGNEDEGILHFVALGDVQKVISMIENGIANVNGEKGEIGTPLIVAADRGHLELVKALLSHGADPNKADVEGMTALECARASEHSEIIDILLSHGAKE